MDNSENISLENRNIIPRTYQLQSSNSKLGENGFIMLKSRLCKIVEISTSKDEKSSVDMVHVVGVDVFTLKQYEGIFHPTDNVDVPYVVEDCDYSVDESFENSNLVFTDDDKDEPTEPKIPDGDLAETN